MTVYVCPSLSGPGSAALLVPGGAAEALISAPGTCDLVGLWVCWNLSLLIT